MAKTNHRISLGTFGENETSDFGEKRMGPFGENEPSEFKGPFSENEISDFDENAYFQDDNAYK